MNHNHTFRIKNVDVSVVNAVRRTLLSDIQTVVFRTSPYERSGTTITTNTTRFNNEIIKHRLSCVPIHTMPDDKSLIEDHIMELDMTNDTIDPIIVTTEQFRVKHAETGEYMSDAATRRLFPPSKNGYFIDFVRLQPRIGDSAGETIQLTAKFDIGTCIEDGAFNVVSNSTYKMVQDDAKVHDAELHMKSTLEGTKDEVRIQMANWRHLEAPRIVVPNTYDFTVETIGVYSNTQLIQLAKDILKKKLVELQESLVLTKLPFEVKNEVKNEADDKADEAIESPDVKTVNASALNVFANKFRDFKKVDTESDKVGVSIRTAISTIANCFDVNILNEGHTIGVMLKKYMFDAHVEGDRKFSYCGFTKTHPHDTYSTIRVAYTDPSHMSDIKTHIDQCVQTLIRDIDKIQV